MRARCFLPTNHKITAEKALEWGVVNEVLPKDQLLGRAYELARDIVRRPPMVLHHTRALFTQELKRRVLDELSPGSASSSWPSGCSTRRERYGGHETLLGLADFDAGVRPAVSWSLAPFGFPGGAPVVCYTVTPPRRADVGSCRWTLHSPTNRGTR